MTSSVHPLFKHRWLAMALLAVSQLAGAAENSDKARINQARAEADAALAAQEAECHKRFAVNSCLNEARRQHRSVVGPLREALLLQDEKQRKQRAVDRAERIRAKAESTSGATAAPTPSETASAPAIESRHSTPRPLIRPRLRSTGPTGDTPLADMPVSTPEPADPSTGVADVLATDPARTPKRHKPMPDPSAMQHSSDRLHEIEARRDSVLKRNAERAASKPPSAPLLVPAVPASPTASPVR